MIMRSQVNRRKERKKQQQTIATQATRDTNKQTNNRCI